MKYLLAFSLGLFTGALTLPMWIDIVSHIRYVP